MKRAVALLCGLFAVAGAVHAQTTFATITGTVTDPTGAVAPRITVSATHVATNITTTTESNEAGVYTLAQLKEGEYTLRARGAGFREFVAQNIVLVARDYRRVDVRLEVGAVETVVEVSAGATLIETETARIADTKTAGLMKSIPLNTRSIWAFLSLSPAVLQAGSGSSTIRFAGSRGNQSHWAIDGTTMSDGVDETQIGPLANYIEWIQELKIDVSNNTADFGTIGQVTSISKSGSNELHGSVYDYYSTPWFRARNPFALARGTGVSHGVGATVGGPVWLPKTYNGKDRSFFFFAFETSRGSAVTQALNPTVPLAPWRQGDFSALPTVVRDPFGGNTPFPGNRLPASRLNATAVKLQERFYPLPNFGDTSVLVSQNYRENKIRPRDPSTNITVRGDHRFSPSDSLFGRFSFQRGYNRPWENNLPTIGRLFQRRDNRAMSLSYTHTFSPTQLNEFRYGFALNNNPIIPPLDGLAFVKEFGLVGLAPDLPDIKGMLNVSFSGLGLTGLSQSLFRQPGFRNFLQEFQDHYSWFRGRHNLKFGGMVTKVEWDDRQANASLFGNVQFSNRFSGFPYTDFLLGIPTTASRAFAPVRVDRLRYQYDFFVADDFKVNQRLTLNIGLRYEYHPVWTEEHGLTSMFDLGSGKIVVQDGSLSKVSPLMPRGYVDVVEAKGLGLPGSTIIRSDKNNFAPRIGLAWRPWGNRTVFRSGFGIFLDVVPRNLNQGGIPYVINEPSHTNAVGNPTVILPRVFPDTGTGGISTVGIPAAINPDLQIPYSMQYNLTIEHSRWDTGFRISYIGTNTRKGDWSYDINSPVPDNRPYVDKPRLFPRYPGIGYFTNGAGHQYHSLTLEAERQLAKGLYFQSSWVWARDIGDLNRGAAPENPFDRKRERAVWEDIPTHRVTNNWVYQLPFGRGRHWLRDTNRLANLAVGGWELSGIYSLYSGQFLTPFWTGPDPTGTAFTSSRTPANVTRRPDHLRNANLPEGQRLVNRWFDASAFGPPRPGSYGTSAKGVIKGPGVNVWHVGFIKNFEFADRGPRLRWELTATNFFNHPNYSNPNTNITSLAQVGVISGVGGVNGASTGDQPGARSFRMGVRVEW
jgi:hypothetical protein